MPVEWQSLEKNGRYLLLASEHSQPTPMAETKKTMPNDAEALYHSNFHKIDPNGFSIEQKFLTTHHSHACFALNY